TFAVMTIFSSGISMYALAKLFELVLGWSFHGSIVLSAVIVLIYIFLGGLTSAIYNEVLQFFLIVLGFLPLVLLGLKDVGGWSGLTAKLATVATNAGFEPGDRKSTRLNSSHVEISYAVFCLKKKKRINDVASR